MPVSNITSNDLMVYFFRVNYLSLFWNFRSKVTTYKYLDEEINFKLADTTTESLFNHSA